MTKKPKLQLPNFITLKASYDKLSNGHKADIKRVRSMGDLRSVPAFYHWALTEEIAAKLVNSSTYNIEKMARIAYFIPLIEHVEEGDTIGQVLAKKNISEARVMQCIKAKAPKDLAYLKLIAKHASAKDKALYLDWPRFGKILYYWDSETNFDKENILRDFIVNQKDN